MRAQSSRWQESSPSRWCGGWTSRRLWQLLLTSFAMFVGAPCGSAVAQGPLSTSDERLKVAIDSLKTWRSHFTSIHLEWHKSNFEQLKARFPEITREAYLSDFHLEQGLKWSERGFEADWDCAVEKGKRLRHRKWGSDDRFSFRANWSGDEVSSPMTFIQVTDRVDRGAARSSVLMAPLFMLWLSSHGVWLPEHLSDGSNVVSVEQKSEDLVVVVKKDGSLQRLTLDHEHSFLPSRAEPTEPDRGFGYTVTEFSKLEEGIDFPWKGTLKAGVEPPDEWYVTRVKLNSCDSVDHYHPPVPGPEAVVWDIHGHFQWPGKAEYLRKQAARGNKKASSPTFSEVVGAVVTVSESGLTHLWNGLFWGGCALLGVCATLYFRRRSPRSDEVR
jgi:hypothetical protein